MCAAARGFPNAPPIDLLLLSASQLRS